MHNAIYACVHFGAILPFLSFFVKKNKRKKENNKEIPRQFFLCLAVWNGVKMVFLMKKYPIVIGDMVENCRDKGAQYDNFIIYPSYHHLPI